MDSPGELFRDALERGCRRLTAPSRKAVASYIQSQEVAGGGFMNRAGSPDLYYTFFGLACALFLGVKVNTRRHRAFLRQFDRSLLDMPHLAAHAQSANMLQALSMPSLVRQQRIMAALYFTTTGSATWPEAPVREPSENPAGDPHAPYTVFLAALVAGIRHHRERMAEWHARHIPAYRTPDGGWSNIRGSAVSSVNATTATMMMMHLMRKPADALSVGWLKNQQRPDGGFAVAAGVPVADLLSTATALVTLQTYRTAPLYPATGFVQLHWRDDGGFAGTFMDEISDCEYTFYGLLALGADRA